MNLTDILNDAVSGKIANWTGEKWAEANRVLTGASDREAADVLYKFTLEKMRAAHSVKILKYTAMAQACKSLFH
ncbi:hypothetical protein [Collimonas sp.]|jgi:hypothetical protein|uniref:hypothetical protein n=1 Tax=Collimonas sp. TaxID=1963772 RepID=UPI002C570E73|nr:hypothetical protein [Collimonas sp.]HWW06170.1 hypothetical protein [Collimonas sp.]